ncbi:MAG: tetratricopeptide repeat protein [Rhodospirillaceae bacterium]|nr:tetratricopeptide repeat protein [Rhodospirillaceae bacterium]
MAGPPTFDPASAHGVIAQATALLEQGRTVEAIGLLQNAVAADAANAELRFTLGVALTESGDARLAAPVLLKATRLAPGWLAPRLMLAKALHTSGRSADALSVLRQTTQDMPDAADAWALYGNLARQSGDNAAAIDSYEHYLQLQPNDVGALNNLAVALRAQHRIHDAIAVYKTALRFTPDTGLLHANLGNALDAAGLSAEAEHHLRKAVGLMPGAPDAAYNLAAHLTREERPDEAAPILREIVLRHPDRWDAWTNLGVALVALGELREAEACYRAALGLAPSAPETHYNLAWLLLLDGQWREGWTEYEWRWQLPNFSSRKRAHTTPAWDGTPQPGRTILLHAEQGLGDTIQFARFAKAVRAKCHRVIVDAPKGLIPLLQTIEGIDAVVDAAVPSPPHDVHAHLLGLPRLLGITPSSISPEPYVSTPTAIAPHLQLPATTRPRIGFVWAGSADNKIDRRRSCDVANFLTLAQATDADFVSLQIGPRAQDLSEPKANIVARIDGRAADWTETAQILAQIDLVISVDTAVAHLAGAMGKQTWILLPFSPDFRWLLTGAATPWYSSVRLFRQRVRGDWASLFHDVGQALTLWIRSRG